MKTLIRTLLMLALIVWLGGEIFFPVMASVVFPQLAPNKHAAGQIVGSLLQILHGMGLVCGLVLVALFALGSAWSLFKPRIALAALGLVLLMMGLTAYSQFGIIPTMERDRARAAGGVMDSLALSDPTRVEFDRLHTLSTRVEGAVLLLGIVVTALAASAEALPK